MIVDLHTAWVDVRAGETLEVSGPASIELVQKSGQLARLRVVASLDVVVSKKPQRVTQVRDKHGLVKPG